MLAASNNTDNRHVNGKKTFLQRCWHLLCFPFCSYDKHHDQKRSGGRSVCLTYKGESQNRNLKVGTRAEAQSTASHWLSSGSRSTALSMLPRPICTGRPLPTVCWTLGINQQSRRCSRTSSMGNFLSRSSLFPAGSCWQLNLTVEDILTYAYPVHWNDTIGKC